MPTTPKYAFRYPVPTDPADVPTDMQRLATDVETALSPVLPPQPVVNGQFVKGVGGVAVWAPLAAADLPTVPYGTTLPASPVNGQEAVLVNDPANPTYQWRFRYNSGSSSPYKWEFVGGAPYGYALATTQTLGAANQWVNIGPTTLPLPRAGEYLLSAFASVAVPSAGVASPYLGIYATTAGNNLAALNATGQATWSLSLSIVNAKPPPQSAGTQIGLSGFGPAGTAYAAGAAWSILPIRVS